MKNPNGYGCVTKLSGNRRRPWAIKLTKGYTEEGKLQYTYLSYHRTKREAQSALAMYNDDPFSLSKYTFKELYDEYIATQEPTKAYSTIKNHKAAIAHMRPLWDKKVQEIDRLVLQRYFMRLDVTPSILNNIQRTMQQVFKYGVRLGVMPISILQLKKVISAKPTKEANKHVHTLITKEERAELWKRADEPFVRLILVYIYTGLRYRELYELKEEDFHEDELYIEVKHSKTKAGIRCVPICDRIKGLLPIMKVPPYTTYHDIFRIVMPDHMPHDTRHTFISMLAENGVDQKIIKDLVGHSRRGSVTDIYTHITMDKLREAVNTLGE